MKTLFIQGPEKTATSTITGILNCHPEIFILFENYLNQPKITKYGNQLLDRYPEARQFFRSSEDYGKPVQDFFGFLQQKEPNYSYRFIGTKINSFDPLETQKKTKHKTIFMMRDIRTWLIKESIIKYYRTDLDIVIPAVEYLEYIIKTTLYEHTLSIHMEDLIVQNEQVIDTMSNYLGLELKPYTNKWWEKIGDWDEKNPKSVFRLDKVHYSSKVKPEKLDTKTELLNHPFWSEYLPIFDKYYFADETIHFIEDDILKDLEYLSKLKKFSPIPFKNVFANIESERFGFSNPRKIHYQSDKNKSVSQQSLLQKIIRKKRRVAKVLFE